MKQVEGEEEGEESVWCGGRECEGVGRDEKRVGVGACAVNDQITRLAIPGTVDSQLLDGKSGSSHYSDAMGLPTIL